MRCESSCFSFLYEFFVERFSTSSMGAGASSHVLSEEEKHLQDLESRLGRDRSLLGSAFSHLSPPGAPDSVQQSSIHISKLEQCFSIKVERIKEFPSEDSSDLGKLLAHLGPVVVQIVFKPEKEHLNWIQFLTGYDVCIQNAGANRLKFLLVFLCQLRNRAQQVSSELEMRCSNDSEQKFEGRATRRELRDFLWICWLMMYYTRLGDDFELVNVEPLVNGAFSAGNASPDAKDMSLQAVYSWMINTIPNVANALVEYMRACLQHLNKENDEKTGPLAVSTSSRHFGLLTPGRTWSLGLSQKDHIGAMLFSAFFQDQISLLYRSSLHGKGMNRFWTQAEGYEAAVLMLFSATSTESTSSCVLAAVIPGGLQNKDSFYGSSSCCLISIEPEFVLLRATGREKNYVYSHKTAAGTGYNRRPMPNGIGFGGTLGNERVWLDDDFATLTVRHHAVDKTYQPGMLVPKQGYGLVHCQVLGVELWGLGGKEAEEQMTAFQQRTNLFAEQRRKVDLKAFGNWQDSPEKMMMDMVSDPNGPQREER